MTPDELLYWNGIYPTEHTVWLAAMVSSLERVEATSSAPFSERSNVHQVIGYLRSEMHQQQRDIADACAPWFEAPTANSRRLDDTEKR